MAPLDGREGRESLQGAAERESSFGTLPLLRHEREWGFLDFTWVNIGMAVATWAFLVGGATALFVGAAHGVLAIIVGTTIGAAVVAVGVCISAGKYGTEQYTLLRSVFGTAGSRLMVILLLAVFGIGWASVLSIMFGRAGTNIVNTILDTDLGPGGLSVTAFGLLAIAISWVVLWRGPVSINWLNRIVAPGLMVMCALMLILIFADVGWSGVADAKPVSPFGDDRVDFMIAVELSLSATLGWWPITGNVARLTRTPRAAMWPNMLGIGLAQIVATSVGLLAALALKDSDPTVWMVPLGGVAFGVLALAFIALANVTSMVAIFYGMAVAIRQGRGRLMRLSWGPMTALLFVPAIIAAFFPQVLYDNFTKFLAWTVLIFSPVSGVTLADFLVLRRRRIDHRALYDESRSGRYAFWGGWNPVAFGSVAIGALTYYLLLNPQTLAPQGPFDLLSASGPACVVGAVSYLILTKLFVERTGKGGYGEPEPAVVPSVSQPAAVTEDRGLGVGSG
jgi:NCS1 family nucleobase:cation symporter-1